VIAPEENEPWQLNHTQTPVKLGKLKSMVLPSFLSRPRILSISGEIFFAFVLLEMIEISQGFKTFEPI
jgi:hypothetical protein